jgi:hypothetical protein
MSIRTSTTLPGDGPQEMTDTAMRAHLAGPRLGLKVGEMVECFGHTGTVFWRGVVMFVSKQSKATVDAIGTPRPVRAHFTAGGSEIVAAAGRLNPRKIRRVVE